ncbi:MAG: transposase, partial [Elusimicrobiota bacterium]|nr:transposase [Elusimicrobiota bacterium]
DQIYQAKERGKKNLPFDKDKFIYDETTDGFTCPEGNKLHYIGNTTGRGGQIVKVYHSNSCKGCKYFGQCTTSPKGRIIEVSEHEHLIKKMREKLSTPEGKRLCSIRKITAEPVLGNLSQNLGFRGFLLRGLHKVKGEFSLMCIAHNLLKIARTVRNLGKNLKELLSHPKIVPALDTS